MTPITSASSVRTDTPVLPTHPPSTYEVTVGLSVGCLAAFIIIIITITFFIIKRRRYRTLSGNDGVELEMQDPLIRNDAESQL